MAKNRKPKWAVSVAKAMQKSCPPNCPNKASGIMRDMDGNILQVYTCRTYCKLRIK